MSINKEKVQKINQFLIILLSYYQLFYAVACSIFVLQSHRKLQPQDPLFSLMDTHISLTSFPIKLTFHNPSFKSIYYQYREHSIYAKGWRGLGGMDWEFGISRCKAITYWIVLLQNTGNYIQYPVINHNGENHLIIEQKLTM